MRYLERDAISQSEARSRGKIDSIESSNSDFKITTDAWNQRFDKTANFKIAFPKLKFWESLDI
jgi:hypothetical protein